MNDNENALNEDLASFLGEDSSTTETAKLGFAYPDAIYELKVTDVKFHTMYSEKKECNYLCIQIYFNIENVIKGLGKGSVDITKLVGKKMVQTYFMNLTASAESDAGRKEEDAKLNAVVAGLGGDVNLVKRIEKIQSTMGKITAHKLTTNGKGYANFEFEDYKVQE